MDIKAADVMKLRQMTGAGMMDCKKALVEANGDYERAQEIIREKGKLVAAKRADRETTEGAVVARVNGRMPNSRSLQTTSLMPPSRIFQLTQRLSRPAYSLTEGL